jgi:hypothetical protein
MTHLAKELSYIVVVVVVVVVVVAVVNCYENVSLGVPSTYMYNSYFFNLLYNWV